MTSNALFNSTSSSLSSLITSFTSRRSQGLLSQYQNQLAGAGGSGGAGGSVAAPAANAAQAGVKIRTTGPITYATLFQDGASYKQSSGKAVVKADKSGGAIDLRGTKSGTVTVKGDDNSVYLGGSNSKATILKGATGTNITASSKSSTISFAGVSTSNLTLTKSGSTVTVTNNLTGDISTINNYNSRTTLRSASGVINPSVFTEEGGGGNTGASGSTGSTGSTGATGPTVVSGNGATVNLTAAVDNFSVTGSNNVINALAGNDTGTVSGNGNIVNAGDGNDTLTVTSTAGENEIDLGNGNDTVNLSGDLGDYTISYSTGNPNQLEFGNTVTGTTTYVNNAENFTFNGGPSIDFATVKASANYVQVTNGNQSVVTSTGDDTVLVTDYALNSSIFTGDGSDTIRIYNGAEGNVVNSGNGNDIIDVLGATQNENEINGGNGTDTVNFSGSISDYTISFNSNNPNQVVVTSNTGGGVTTVNDVENFTFNGGPAVDFATVKAGANQTIATGDISNGEAITTGTGNDSITVTDFNTVNDNFISGGAGTDTINFSGNINQYSISYDDSQPNQIVVNDLASGNNLFINDVENFTFNGGPAVDFATVKAGANQTVNVTGNGETITTGTGSDNISITSGFGNTINTGAGNDTITTTLNGGNTINGGNGTDTINFALDLSAYNFSYSYDTPNTLYIYEDIEGEYVTVSDVENFSFNGGPAISFNTLKQSANQTYNITTGGTYTGENGVDRFNVAANAGNVIIDGAGSGENSISLTGTASSYTVQRNQSGDTLTLSDASGNTTQIKNIGWVQFSGSWSTFASLQSSAGYSGNLTGNSQTFNLSNSTTNTDYVTLTGNSNTVNAQAGNDTINIAAGGSTADNVVNAGDGNDTVNLGAGSNDNQINLGNGNDTINVTDTIGAANTIDGGSGSDLATLTGNIGDYSVAYNANRPTELQFTNNITGAYTEVSNVENFSFNGGPAIDFETVKAGANQTVTFAADNGTYATGSGQDTITVTASDSNINSGAQRDTITVTGQRNQIGAGSGDDTFLITTGENNTYSGGSGDDLANYGSVGLGSISVVDNGVGGLAITANGRTNTFLSDTEFFNFNGTTKSYAEVAALAGPTQLGTTGNVFNGNYVGTTGSDTYTVYSGATLNTGKGNDVVYFDSSSSNSTINFGDENDTLVLAGSSSSYTIADNGGGSFTLTDSSSRSVTVSNLESIAFNNDINTRGSFDNFVKENTALNGTNNDSNSTITLSNVTDTVTFNGSNNVISTSTGNDVLTVNGNNNTVNGGSGDSIYYIGATANGNTFNGSTGTDRVGYGTTTLGSISVVDNGTSVSITSGGVTNTFSNDIEQFTFNGVSQTYAQVAALSPTGYSGTDSGSSGTINLTGVADTITLTGNGNTLNALAGDDTITLSGSAAANTINAGDGNDVIRMTSSSLNNNQVYGGNGTDTIDYSSLGANRSAYSITKNGAGLLISRGGRNTYIDSTTENLRFADGVFSFDSLYV